MAVNDNDSIAGLLRSLLADTRELIRDELDLMRAEIHEELKSARTAGIAMGAGIFVGLLGMALLSVALGSAAAYWFSWPVWAGYGLVSLLLLVGAYIAVTYGRKRLSRIRALPKTRETMKENLSWIQSKSAPR